MHYLKYILAGIFTTLCLLLSAQQYTNEWIEYDQKYYKIKIAEDGIYRLDYNTLQNYGFPVSSVNPLNIQLFAKGEEQPVFIKGESDGSLDSADYIEFYAEGNDGWLDKQLFVDPSKHLNQDYSLFSDTAVYFLTWNNSTANKRFNIVNNTNYSSYTAESHYKKVVREEYPERYFRGEPSSYGVTDPEYTAGEGWFDNPFSLGGSKNKYVATPKVYDNGPDADVDFAVVGASDYKDSGGSNVAPDHHLRVEFANKVLDTLYDGYGVHRFDYSVDPAELSSNNLFSFSSINDLGVGADRNTIAYVEIGYPKKPELNNTKEEYFFVDDAASGQTRIDFSDFNASSGADAYVYDISNDRRIAVTLNGSDAQVLIPNGGGEKKCLLTSSDQTRPVNTLFPVSNTSTPNTFTNFDGSSADYIIISHEKFIGSSSQSIQNYANYRENNGLNTLVADVDELYNQFAYGIHNHPFGIRKFIEFAWDNFSSQPEYLFLVGKGYKPGISQTRRGNLYHDHLVPSMGTRPSDILFSNGIVDNLFQPALATGRLAAQTTDHVDLYLDKVKAYDNARKTPKEWQKQILHFAGGSNSAEQNMLQGFLSSYATIARDTFLGADIHTFYKSTTDPIQINMVDEIRDYINNGALMLTFFGHAAGVGFDISIDDPATYDNQGKYPFLLANSCFTGDLFTINGGSSEEWVLVEDKGVIGYLASVSPAITSSLNLYSNTFYENLSVDNYGAPLGKLIQQTVDEVQLDNFYRKEISLAMTLHGDPAVSLYSYDKPDYAISSSDLALNPAVVTTDRDSFRLEVYVKNLGKAIRDSIFIEVNRTMPQNNNSSTLVKYVAAPLNKDTITFKFPVNSSDGVGQNKIEVNLDAYQSIAELSESNNIASIEFDIKSANIIPVYPGDFAVVPGPGITLKASTSNPLAQQQNYVFQIDTTPKFNSPLFASVTKNSAGGVVEWDPPVMMQDSMVYYWRVSKDSTKKRSYDWRMNSFQYISGNQGWAQAHFPQFENNEYRFMNPDMNKREFRFVNVNNIINVETGVYPNVKLVECAFRFNNGLERVWTCLNQNPDFIGILIATFDTISGEPVKSKVSEIQSNGLGKYNNVHCQNDDQSTFEYYTSSTQGWSNLYEAPRSWWFDQITNFIDSLPDGTPVLIYSVQNHNAENYTNEMYEAFESIGSAFIRTIDNNQPYIIFGEKGSNIGDANESVGLDETDDIKLKDSVKTRWKEGFVKSPVIGPSQKWQSLYWDFDYSDNSPVDQVRLDVLGHKPDGSVDTVIHNLPADSTEIHNLDNFVSAQDYPEIQLVMSTRDDSLNTPAQLKKWQVLYAGAPETAINPKKKFSFYQDTIMQGDTVRLAIATENISDYDMDSLKVKYRVTDHNQTKHLISEKRLKPHPAGDVLIDSVKFDTKDFEKLNKLFVEFNPDQDQYEVSHINNVAEIPFYVRKDKSNPLLDVTFDGIHIMDGDIVSAKPHILITLKDENKYLALKDTSNVNVFIKGPNDQDYRNLYFNATGNDQLVFHPAELPENECMIEYDAEFKEDGMYNLRVQAKDVSGNNSGNVDYTINFEVVNKSTITNVLNWPNPFSTRTHFVFTLTGSCVPDYMRIQIMTVTGKVVREIGMEELGPIHIGKNVTDYAWDGTDEYGDRLANGVYIYRVLTDMDGESIEKRSTEADKFFDKGYGKMYLIR
ncbi:MAG: hypothetical protein K9I29_05635 [Bacteroidales bacterium]|nr:hypothetical protein [Bacteroidales bacterium]MCF8327757.1 hypothetical protein [Bacteroidales bacterium]